MGQSIPLLPILVDGAHLPAQPRTLSTSSIHTRGDTGLDLAQHSDGAKGCWSRVVLELVSAGVEVHGLADRLADRCGSALGGGRGLEKCGLKAIAQLAGDAERERAQKLHCEVLLVGCELSVFGVVGFGDCRLQGATMMGYELSRVVDG